MSVGLLYVLFGKMSIQVFYPFFNRVVWFFDVELYELFKYLDINSLLVISFANVFSRSVGCLFTLLMISFAVQKLLSLVRSHLFIFAFISFALGDRSKKCCYDLCQKAFCLCLLLGVLWFPALHLGLYSILSLFLNMVLENVLISFFYM